MKTIRIKTFETNSSSCHSISFQTEESATINSSSLTLSLSVFNSNNQLLQSEQEKLSYAFTLYVMYLNDLMTTEKFNWYQERKELCKEFDIRGSYDVRLVTNPKSIESKFQQRFQTTVDSLVYFFGKRNVVLSLGKDIVLNHKYSRTTESFLFLMGDHSYGVDHQSSPCEDSEALELAKMVESPEELYKFVASKESNILCSFGG